MTLSQLAQRSVDEHRTVIATRDEDTMFVLCPEGWIKEILDGVIYGNRMYLTVDQLLSPDWVEVQ